ncbi:hypothetical protein [Ferrovibrio sp.]|uniref:hypothetical protein n=1 Tax=Ferrovibrio sp. TaxID=1917215 RepID=UPI0035B12E69
MSLLAQLWRDRDFLAGLLLVLLMLLSVAGMFAVMPDLTLPAAGLLVLFAWISFPHLRRVARVFLLLCAIVLVLSLLFDPSAWQNIQLGLRRAVSYASFFTALTFIREAGLHSDLLRRAGDTIVRQDPGRQYVILTIGGHLFGMMMNFGSLGMLGTMIRRSVDGLQPEMRARMLRHSFIALLRGFTATGTWSPMALSPLVVASILPGVSWEQLMPYGVALAATLMFAGWLVNRYAEPALGVVEGIAWENQLAWRPIIGLLAIVSTIFAGILILRSTLGTSTSEAVIIMLPVVSLLWMLAQCLRRPSNLLRSYGWRLRQLTAQTLSSLNTEIVVLSTAGFIGGAASGLLPYELMGQWLRQVPLAFIALPLMIFWGVIATGYMGVNPLITISIIGTLMAQPEAFGIEPVFLGLVYLLSWSLTGQLSPFTASNLLLASIAEVRSTEIVHQWNRRFAVVIMLAGSIAIAIGSTLLHR